MPLFWQVAVPLRLHLSGDVVPSGETGRITVF